MSKRPRTDGNDTVAAPDEEAAAVSQPEQPNALVLQEYLPAWLALFRSAAADAESLGRLACLVSASLARLLGEEEEIWTHLCRAALGAEVYGAIPAAVRKAKGDRWLLLQMTSEQPLRTIPKAVQPKLSRPAFASSDLTILVKVWRDEELLVSRSVTGKSLDPLFERSLVPCFHEEYDYEKQVGCGYECWPDKDHDGEIEVELPSPVLLAESGGWDRSSREKSLRASVRLLISKGDDSKLVHLLEYPGKSKKIIGCENYGGEPDSMELESGESVDGDFERTGLTQGLASFDLDHEGEAMLSRLGNYNDQPIVNVNGMRFALHLKTFHKWADYDEEEDRKVKGTDLLYLTHLTFQFLLEYDEKGLSCNNPHCGMGSEPLEPAWFWEGSGLTIAHLLDKIKGLKM